MEPNGRHNAVTNVDEILDVKITSMTFDVNRCGDELIKNLDFRIEKGQFVSFLGPTGCGKTTLLRIIAGLEQRFIGSVIINGRPVVRAGRDIQLVFQDVRLLPWKSVAGNVRFALPASAIGREQLVHKAIQAVDLEECMNSWPATLSGGEEIRVALARTIVALPKVLLLDEPFRNLDYRTKRGIQERLLGILQTSETTVIHVSHSIEDAVMLSDVIFCFSRRPMSIIKMFFLPMPKPRDMTTVDELRIATEITRLVMNKIE